MFLFFQYLIFNHLYKYANRVFVLRYPGVSIELPYFYHPHGSWHNERCVEIPIVSCFLNGFDSDDVLEVGNVLSNYFHVNHVVLDKYDDRIGVITEDVCCFDTIKRFKFIFSISTMEHVGFDEYDDVLLNKPDNVLYGVDNLKRILSVGGVLLVTMPLGYRMSLDGFIFDNSFGFSSLLFLKRVSRSNRWVEISLDEARGIRYGFPFPSANGLCIGFYFKDM